MNRLPCLTEAEEGKILVAWLRIHNIEFTHVGNETGHSPEAKRRAIRMKQQGTSRGFPDYVIALPGVGIVYIELKRVRGSTISPEQRQWIDTLNQCPGAEAYIAKGAQAAIDIVSQFIGAKQAVDSLPF